MKKIVLTSLSALMLSVAAAGAAETCKTCESNNNTKVFFGVNAGMTGFNYDQAFNFITETVLPLANDVALKFPKYDTTIGMEGGMRFGKYKSVWNGGFTISADKTLGKKPNIIAPAKFWNPDTTGWSAMEITKHKLLTETVSSLKANVNILAATFDNYIRLNKSVENRLDFVVGVGVADVETDVNLYGLGVSLSSHAAVFKAGLELELTDNISMTMGTRMYTPVAGQYYDSFYSFKGGLKFLF